MTDVATIHFKQIGSRTTEFTLVEKPTVDDRLSNEVLKSSVSLKQEIKYDRIIDFIIFYIRFGYVNIE